MQEIEACLNHVHDQLNALQRWPGISQIGVGVPELDSELFRLGRRWIAGHDTDFVRARTDDREENPDVFIATLLYPTGGHTALIGDFARALSHRVPPVLLLTNCFRESASSYPAETIERTAIPRERVEILSGATMAARFVQLGTRLKELQSHRVFLFQHPDDPVAPAVIQPELTPRSWLVHHVDSGPCLGLHLPGIQIIDLTPGAAAMTRAQDLTSALLLLTAPDPGLRPHDFVRKGRLVTATSGSENKFVREYPLGYADAVAVILGTTGGCHVHIGPLSIATSEEISAALRRVDVASDRFVHVPHVASLAQALWKYECDVYFASFPIGGARANVEVLASATPHLRHVAQPNEQLMQDRLRPEGGIVWRTFDELREVLRSLTNADLLEEKSRAMRAAYEKFHHPRVFAQKLDSILHGRGGWADEDRDERDKIARARFLAATAPAPPHP